MQKKKSALLLLLAASLLLMPTLASAQSAYSDFYVIPVVSHVTGINNTMWMSDLTIQNFQSTPLTVQLVLIQGGENNPDNVFPVIAGNINGSVTVPANGTVMLKDFLNGYNGMTMAQGALLVGSDRPFAVTSRSYTAGPNGGTYGQTIMGASGFLDNTTGMTDLDTAVAYVPGVVNNAQFRTNLGFVVGNGSGSGETLGVQVTLRNGQGTTVGTRLFTVPSGNFEQVQFSAASVLGDSAATFDVGSAEFRIVQGSGAVIPYASVVDNTTADASFIMGTFPDNSPLGKTGFVSPFRFLFDRTKLTK